MSDALSEAQERYREALDASRAQREQVAEDLAFSDPSSPRQWDEQLKAQRESDPGGARPCLVFDQTGQYVSNVAGQVDQRPPALHAVPVDGGADKKVAEQCDGIFRHIEHSSRAQQHYTRALTSAARAGVGYLIVRPEYVDRALGYQEPRIGSEGDPLRVVFDPWSVELDGSDATFGYLLSPMSPREFERKWGKDKKKVSFGDDEGRTVEDERESIVTVEEWRVVEKTTNIVVFRTPEGEEDSLPEEDFWIAKQKDPRLEPGRTYADKYRCVKWARYSGVDVLSKEIEYPADGIGIVPVYGYVGWSDGRMNYCGIPRRARQPQQAYNFHRSEIRALMGAAPKAPWIGPERAFRGFEKLWDRASVDTRAYLPYNDLDESGQPIAAPTRPQVSIDLRNHQAGAQEARLDIQAAIGMYAANIGKESNATSGVAYDAQKQQGEASTAHFPGNLEASLGQVGRLILQMVPRLIDTKRQVRILGIDMTPGKVVVDPSQDQALVETDNGLSINPGIGRYDVRAVVGASYATARQESREELREMMRSNPEMTPAIAPLWAATLDIPNGDKLTQVLTAVAPEPVKAILQPEREDSTAALKAENEQLKQALSEAMEVAQEAQQEIATAQAEREARDDENAIKAYEAETKRIVGLKDAITPEQVQTLVVQTIEQMLSNPQPMAGDEPMNHEMQPMPAELQSDPTQPAEPESELQ